MQSHFIGIFFYPFCPFLPLENFFRTITDDEGGRPRNVKVLLSLLNSYTGPYEAEVSKENASERNDQEKSVVEKDRLCIEYDNPIKSSQSSAEIYSSIQVGDSQIPLAKRISRVTTKRSEKETKRLAKTVSLKVTSTKSICK